MTYNVAPEPPARYDPTSQVTQVLHQLTATSTQINQAAYAYNPVGNRTSLVDRRGSQAFGYDTLDRLTSASHPLLATPQAFAYDAAGNRTTGGSVVNAGNQLTADANYSYQYDDNGNLTRKTLLTTGNFTQYTYDAENRLVKVEEFAAGNPTALATSTYRYDGLGRRIEKVANGQTKRYIYDGEDISDFLFRRGEEKRMREVKVSLVITSTSLRLSEISAKIGCAHSSGSHDRGTSSLPEGKPFNQTIWRMDSMEPESAPLEKHFASIGAQIPAKSIMDSGLLTGDARCFFDIAAFFDDAMCSIDIPKICLKAVERYGAEISVTCYPVDDKLGSKK